ncbi:hypothetical protein B484DRAFT_444121 [Ochromonadaceae sp. CCMP2298]|nr:hypothetical protein B484DRAFT_444121 [Ochromonadaceae sp. CCMP2298]
MSMALWSAAPIGGGVGGRTALDFSYVPRVDLSDSAPHPSTRRSIGGKSGGTGKKGKKAIDEAEALRGSGESKNGAEAGSGVGAEVVEEAKGDVEGVERGKRPDSPSSHHSHDSTSGATSASGASPSHSSGDSGDFPGETGLHPPPPSLPLLSLPTLPVPSLALSLPVSPLLVGTGVKIEPAVKVEATGTEAVVVGVGGAGECKNDKDSMRMKIKRVSDHAATAPTNTTVTNTTATNTSTANGSTASLDGKLSTVEEGCEAGATEGEDTAEE